MGRLEPSPLHRGRTLRAFVSEASAALRQAGAAPITVGLASTRGLPLVRDLGLDFYQVHWYDHVDPPSALVTPASTFGLDAPLWLGEFPTVQSSQAPLNMLSAVEHAGYAGAFAWSYRRRGRVLERGRSARRDVARFARQRRGSKADAV